MKQVPKICCPEMEENIKDPKFKFSRYCPDCGKDIDLIVKVEPLNFDEWCKQNIKSIGSHNPHQLRMVWEAARDQLILSCYKTLTDDEEDGSGYLRDEILSHVHKMVKK